jgi:hypothetical protein
MLDFQTISGNPILSSPSWRSGHLLNSNVFFHFLHFLNFRAPNERRVDMTAASGGKHLEPGGKLNAVFLRFLHKNIYLYENKYKNNGTGCWMMTITGRRAMFALRPARIAALRPQRCASCAPLRLTFSQDLNKPRNIEMMDGFSKSLRMRSALRAAPSGSLAP